MEWERGLRIGGEGGEEGRKMNRVPRGRRNQDSWNFCPLSHPSRSELGNKQNLSTPRTLALESWDLFLGDGSPGTGAPGSWSPIPYYGACNI